MPAAQNDSVHTVQQQLVSSLQHHQQILSKCQQKVEWLHYPWKYLLLFSVVFQDQNQNISAAVIAWLTWSNNLDWSDQTICTTEIWLLCTSTNFVWKFSEFVLQLPPLGCLYLPLYKLLQRKFNATFYEPVNWCIKEDCGFGLNKNWCIKTWILQKFSACTSKTYMYVAHLQTHVFLSVRARWFSDWLNLCHFFVGCCLQNQIMRLELGVFSQKLWVVSRTHRMPNDFWFC